MKDLFSIKRIPNIFIYSIASIIWTASERIEYRVFIKLQGCSLKCTETFKRQVVSELGCRDVFLKHLSSNYGKVPSSLNFILFFFHFRGGNTFVGLVADSYFKRIMKYCSVHFREYPCSFFKRYKEIV